MEKNIYSIFHVSLCYYTRHMKTYFFIKNHVRIQSLFSTNKIIQNSRFLSQRINSFTLFSAPSKINLRNLILEMFILLRILNSTCKAHKNILKFMPPSEPTSWLLN